MNEMELDPGDLGHVGTTWCDLDIWQISYKLFTPSVGQLQWFVQNMIDLLTLKASKSVNSN